MHEARRFLAIGVVSTLAYLVLYAALRGALSAPAANAIALLVTAVGNTAANRRLTFGVRGRSSLARDHLGGLLAFAAALAITTASVLALNTVAPRAPRLAEICVLVVANAIATLVRFFLLRAWIARGRTRPTLTVSLERNAQ